MAKHTYRVLLEEWYTTGIGAELMYMGNNNLTWGETVVVERGDGDTILTGEGVGGFRGVQ